MITLVPKSKHYPEIREAPFGLDSPKDFDVEGSFNAMVEELAKDSKEYGCRSYVVSIEEGIFHVWREQ